MKKLYGIGVLIIMSMPITPLFGDEKREQYKGITTFIAYSEARKKIKEEQAVKDAEFNITVQRINERRFNAAFLGCCVAGVCAALYKQCFTKQYKGVVGTTVLTGTITGIAFSSYKTSQYREFLKKHRFVEK